MIKPNELRCGNYVYVDIPTLRNDEFFNDKVFAIIKMVGEDRVDVQYENNGREILILDKLIPIQLTSEWLLKFGFTQSSCHDSRNIFDRVPLYENNGVAIMLSDSEFWYVTRQYDGGSSDPFERVLEVKSVHQVQNLYYALTGEELTIQE